MISTSFADIFRNNSLKNGLLPIIVDEDTLQQLFDRAARDDSLEVTVDLRSRTLTLPGGRKLSFPVDSCFAAMPAGGWRPAQLHPAEDGRNRGLRSRISERARHARLASALAPGPGACRLGRRPSRRASKQPDSENHQPQRHHLRAADGVTEDRGSRAVVPEELDTETEAGVEDEVAPEDGARGVGAHEEPQ